MSYKLPKGTRLLTEAELEARRAGKGAAQAGDRVVQKAAGDGWAVPKLKLPNRRRGRRRRPPPGIFRMPR